jgi:hypothetical protein
MAGGLRVLHQAISKSLTDMQALASSALQGSKQSEGEPSFGIKNVNAR